MQELGWSSPALATPKEGEVARSPVQVEFTAQQLQLVDRLVDEWHVSREVAIGRAVETYLKGGADVPAPVEGQAAPLTASNLELGAPRYEETLQPVSGKALPVHKGEVLRLSQLEGGQCIDFNAFNLHDYKEHMSVGHSRGAGIRLSEGHALLSNPPRYRPMLFIASMPPTCVTDTLGARCHAVLFEQLLGFDFHTNCQDTFAEAIREFDLTPDDVHDSFNMFMNTNWDQNGSWWIEWNTGKPGDSVDLLACMDTLCVPIVCGSGDAALTSNFFLKPIKIAVFEPTRGSLELVNRVEDRYAAPHSRKTLDDYDVKTIRAKRQLEPNPGYVSNYRNFPLQRESLLVEIESAAIDQLQRLHQDGFARDRADALRRVFMMWFLASRTGSLGKQNFPNNERLTPIGR